MAISNPEEYLVYFVLQGEKIEDIPKEVLMDCAHLVKANSIQGQFAQTCFLNPHAPFLCLVTVHVSRHESGDSRRHV